MSISARGSQALNWPARERVLPPGRHGSFREHLKYALRMVRASAHRPALLAAVSGHTALRHLYAEHPRLFHAPISAFLDRRFSVGRRFEVAIEDLTQALARLGPERIAGLASNHTECLSEPVPGLRVCVALNEVNAQEGLWALSLRDADNVRIYNLSFGFLSDKVVLVGSVQGLPGGEDDARDRIRQLTKDAHGLRPPHLLVEVIRAACARWNVEQLLAIDPSHHIKGRWNQRRSRLKFGYREFWREIGGQQRRDGYWVVPIDVEQRTLDDIPSRKRATYRRRYEMLERLRSDLDAAWQR